MGSVHPPDRPPATAASTSLRLDKYLWYARLVKSRSEAARLCESRHLRMDGRVIDKAHAAVRVGAVLSFPWAGVVRVIRVTVLPDRRGPSPEARATYQDLSPPKKPAITPEQAAAGAARQLMI
jgi:ribosome-associated heat shock protein Hsp15